MSTVARLRRLFVTLFLAALAGADTLPVARVAPAAEVQFVFFSDVHFGLTRTAFRGAADVDAVVVNAALAVRLNALPNETLPLDGGIGEGRQVGPIDFLAVGGDVANRQEATPAPIQSAAASWAQFRSIYLDGLTVTDRSGARAPLYVVPGNHDASNAVGFYRPMQPAVDKTSMAEIYNLMMAPSSRTAQSYDYAKDKILTSRDVGGLHLVFITIWPDAGVRAWMEQDLARVDPATPIFVFAHDPPDSESRHFTNPNGLHDVNATDRFENVLSDTFADGTTTEPPPLIERAAFEDFLRRHPNVSAYFHGHSNWNQFYEWIGPSQALVLHSFRADSPMKGASSSRDETRLSFQLIRVDMLTRTMTVRECLWNADPRNPAAPIAWGGSTTVALYPRPKPTPAPAPR